MFQPHAVNYGCNLCRAYETHAILVIIDILADEERHIHAAETDGINFTIELLDEIKGFEFVSIGTYALDVIVLPGEFVLGFEIPEG